jgi:uncharacterized membrane protein
LQTRLAHPNLGGLPLDDIADIPADAAPVFARDVGYVQHVDSGALQELAEAHDLVLFLTALPGTFADPARPLARVNGDMSDEVADAIAAAYSIGAERTFDQDPRFGLSVLSEIASRALSPAVNDPGTAIDVIGRAVRLLVRWGTADCPGSDDIECLRLRVPHLTARDLFDDVFAPIARDGAGIVEVQIRLQKAFIALSAAAPHAFAREACRHSDVALQRATASLQLDEEKMALRALNAQVHDTCT